MIDAHQHFWRIDRADYGWLTPELATLYRDFLPDDLEPALTRNGITGTILVQAAPTLAETEFLLALAEATPFVLGVVGWVDFASSNAADDIARLAGHPKLVGLRPMIQDIPQDDWMLRPDLTPAFEAMVEHDLTFDALVMPRHLPHLRQLLKHYPRLRTVIDHGAKPEIAAGLFDAWSKDIADIAGGSPVYCKLSGFVTEAGTDWDSARLAPYIEHLIKHFGPERLVWGSDWPVLKLASDYDTWCRVAASFITSDAAKRSIFQDNAQKLYRIQNECTSSEK